MTPAVPLGDAGLSALRGSLDGGAPYVAAHLVRGLVARLDQVERDLSRERLRADRAENARDQFAAKAGDLAGIDRALREAVDYQVAIIGRVEEVAARGVPVGPEVLRVALDPARSLQGAEEAAHRAAEGIPEP